MDQHLNLVLAEDNPDDAELLLRELRRAGFAPECRCVQTESEFISALDPRVDLVVADHSLPTFSGLRALELTQQSGLDLPFILVSGTIGEEEAVRAIKLGATDYLLKDRLGRLGQAVRHALDTRRLRAEQRVAEDQLRLQGAALETTGCAIAIVAPNGRIRWVNPAFVALTGYTLPEIVGTELNRLHSNEGVVASFEELSKTLRAGQSWRGTWKNERRDGSFYTADATITPVSLRNPAMNSSVAVFTDVTEARAAEEALRAREVGLAAAQKRAQLGNWELDEKGRVITWSAQMFEIFEQEPANGLPTLACILSAVHPDDRDVVGAALAANSAVAELHTRLLSAGGVTTWIELRMESVHEQTTGRIRRLGTCQDISDRKRAEQRQAEQVAFVSDVLSSLNSSIVVVNADGVIVTVNEAWRRFASENRPEGLAARDFAGENYLEVCRRSAQLGDLDAERALQGIGSVLAGKAPDFVLEYPCHSATEQRWYSMRVTPLGLGGRGAVIAHVNVTEQRLLEEATLRREQDFRLLFASNPLPMWVYDLPTLRILAVNDAAIEVYGYTREEFLQLTLRDVRPPEDVEAFLRTLRPTKMELGSVGILRHRRKDGTIFLVETATNVISFQGKEARLVLVSDVTERQRTSRARDESEERFRQVVESIHEVFWLYDVTAGALVYVSPAFEKIWGRPRAEAWTPSGHWIEPVRAEDREKLKQLLQSDAGTDSFDATFRIVRTDETERWIRSRAVPVRNEAGTIYRVVGTAEDITDRKHLEAQFLRAQRVEAIGTLSAGIAHDLNNILAPTMMVTSLLREKIHEPGDLEMLAMVEQGARRGASIIKQLLTFSRGIEGDRGIVQAKHLIKEMIVLMRETFPRGITIVDQTAADVPAVIADPTQLSQVLMNLCVNARDAMGETGRLTLSASAVSLQRFDIPDEARATEGKFVVLAVGDTGHGIPAELIDRIFEPFFTTKELGKGTGLGLSTVAGIARSHGGFVRVSSEVGRGTEFRVYLPAAEASDDDLSLPKRRQPAGGNRLILVVDDEAAIRTTMMRTLERHGYRAIAAANGEEGLAVYLKNQSTVRLVVTDLMMPKVSGLAMIRAIKASGARVRFIAMTGLNDELKRNELAELQVQAVLPKPCDPDDLLDAVHRALADVVA